MTVIDLGLFGLLSNKLDPVRRSGDVCRAIERRSDLLRFFSFFAVILVSSDSLLCVLLIMCFSN